MSEKSREYIGYAQASLTSTIEYLADASSYARQAGDLNLVEKINHIQRGTSSLVKEIADKSTSQKG
jgi:hypothetical protein